MSDEKKLTVLVVEPVKFPYVKEIESGYKSIQKEVGGVFQCIYPYEDNVGLLCHDEGKLLNLPPNRFLKDENDKPYDILCGTFLVVGLGTENFESLTPKQIEIYTQKFASEWLVPAPKESKTNQTKTNQKGERQAR